MEPVTDHTQPLPQQEIPNQDTVIQGPIEETQAKVPGIWDSMYQSVKTGILALSSGALAGTATLAGVTAGSIGSATQLGVVVGAPLVAAKAGVIAGLILGTVGTMAANDIASGSGQAIGVSALGTATTGLTGAAVGIGIGATIEFISFEVAGGAAALAIASSGAAIGATVGATVAAMTIGSLGIASLYDKTSRASLIRGIATGAAIAGTIVGTGLGVNGQTQLLEAFRFWR